MTKFDDNIKNPLIANHPLLDGHKKWAQEDWSKADQLSDIF